MGEAARANRVVLSLAHNMAQTNQITAAMIDVLTEFVARQPDYTGGRPEAPGSRRRQRPLTDGERCMSWRDRWGRLLPHLVIWPPILVSCAYVLLFSAWTIWVSFTRSTLMPDYSWAGWRNYSVDAGDAKLAYRLHQPVHLRHLLRRVHHGAGAAAGGADRPAHPRGEHLPRDLPLSAGSFLRRHRHGLGLAAKPQHRHPEADARHRLDQLPLRMADRSGHGDLHGGDRRSLAGVRLCHGAVAGRDCARWMPIC